MAQIIIRNLDNAVVKALKAEAASNGRSMEAEVRAVIEQRFSQDKVVRSRRTLMKKIRKSRIRMPKGVSTTDILREIRDES